VKPETLPIVRGNPRLGVPYAGISKFVAIGLNYSDHAAESGMPIPSEPIIFMKATTSLTGPNDDIIQPKNSTKLDWEVELGVVDRHEGAVRPGIEGARLHRGLLRW
jgi:2-keto-4-pentenoate hydratase/2-oxohepta-3-ene-1,7-dioic acid hydratase in catechol pathway